MKIFVLLILFIGVVMLFGCDNIMIPAGQFDNIDNILIPAGMFEMGSNDPDAFDDEQLRSVELDDFYMDKYEVTNVQYQKFVLANSQWQKSRIAASSADENYLKYWNKNDYPTGKAEHPVVYVSWHAARAYAEWVEKRLPTEAEWEKAARGGLKGLGKKKYPWGDLIDPEKANYGLNIGNTTPVGQYPANDYGLHDMAGNVWEWCSHEYDNVEDSRVLRGGSWLDTARFVRVSARGWSTPTFTSAYFGFRCVFSISSKASSL